NTSGPSQRDTTNATTISSHLSSLLQFISGYVLMSRLPKASALTRSGRKKSGAALRTLTIPLKVILLHSRCNVWKVGRPLASRLFHKRIRTERYALHGRMLPGWLDGICDPESAYGPCREF